MQAKEKKNARKGLSLGSGPQQELSKNYYFSRALGKALWRQTQTQPRPCRSTQSGPHSWPCDTHHLGRAGLTLDPQALLILDDEVLLGLLQLLQFILCVLCDQPQLLKRLVDLEVFLGHGVNQDPSWRIPLGTQQGESAGSTGWNWYGVGKEGDTRDLADYGNFIKDRGNFCCSSGLHQSHPNRVHLSPLWREYIQELLGFAD